MIPWIAAVVFVPYLGDRLLPDLAKLHAKKHGGSAQGHDPYSTTFYQTVREVVEWCVRRRKTVILVTIGLFVVSLLLVLLLARLVAQREPTLRPAVVFVRGGRARVVVARETIDDVLAHDVPPA